MDEGKNLLYQVIENKLSKIQGLDTSSITCDNINLQELLRLIIKDNNNFYLVTDNILSLIINFSHVKNPEEFIKLATKSRDLLIGKNNYNLNVTLSKEQLDNIDNFIKYLENYINSISDEILHKDNLVKRITELRKKVDNNFIINDFGLIEQITYDYDSVNYDKNMLIIMKYINEINLNLLKIQRKNAPIFDVQMLRRPKLSFDVINVLDKLDINIKELPNFIVAELKKVDPKVFVNTFATVRKNMGEHGGILHFIDKDDSISKLLLVLYSTTDTVMNVIDSIKDSDGNIDINILKILVNYTPTVFYSKLNAYLGCKYNDYMANIEYLKKLGIDYKTLITKCPLFMIINHEVLEYTLEYISSVGGLEKNIINRCYKTLSINPSLLIENLNVLKNFNVNLNNYFSEKNTNYNLLKCSNLLLKIKYLKDKYPVFNNNVLDYELLTKLITNKVYHGSMNGNLSWEVNK